MRRTEIVAILLLAFGLMVCRVEPAKAASMGTSFTYMGRLMDTNEPADGLYDFEFRLYDDPCTGIQLGSTVVVDDFDVIDGFFTVELDFGAVFDGNARWLETTVAHADGSDPCTLSPRQETTPAPYAIYAQSAQEANTINGLDSSNFATKLHTHLGEDITAGTVGTDYYSAYNDLFADGYLGDAAGDLAQNNGVLQSTLNADMLDGVDESAFFHLAQNEAVLGRPAFNGGVSGVTPPFLVDSTFRVPQLNADLLDGFHFTAFASSVHSHSAHNHDANYVNVTGDTMTGRLNVNTTGSGIDVIASPAAATTYGIHVDADQSAANNNDIFGLYSDTDSEASTGSTYGTYSNAVGNSYTYGLYGYASSTAGVPWGLYAASLIPSSAENSTSDSFGVYATSTNYGTGNSLGASHSSYQHGMSGTSYGTRSYSRSDNGDAYGTYSTAVKQSSGAGGTAYGGYFTGDNDSADDSYGVYARAIGTGGTNYGLYAYATDGTTNYAGYFIGDVHIVGGGELKMLNNNSEPTVEILSGETGSGDGSAIYMYNSEEIQTIELDADSWDGGSVYIHNSSGTDTITLHGDYNGDGDGRIITDELQITGGSDLSEQFDIQGTEDAVRAGMLVSIDPKRPGKLMVTKNAYDNKVAGVISGAGGVKPGMMMGQDGSEANGDYPVALTGRVYCWADASTGSIEPGDMLTTSSTPGHAMKATDRERSYGTVIGKAMTSLEKGKGLVLVLVSLQ